MNTRKSAARQMGETIDMLSPNNNTSTAPINYPYFSSPNVTNFEGLNDIDMSTNGLHRQSITKKILTSNDSANSNDIISSYVVKKVITNTSFQRDRDDELRVKENYLNHLKSIDITKFSYPNETKPPTDYTYAKTSSYLSQCNQNDDDNIEMPNLRRRSRISPQTSMNLSSSNRTFTQGSPLQLEESLHIAVQNTKTRLTFYQKIKTVFFKTNKPVIVQSPANQKLPRDDFIFIKPSIPNTSSAALSARLNRNIGVEFEDHEQHGSNRQFNAAQQPNRQNIPQYRAKNRQSCFSIFLVLLFSIPFVLFALSRIESSDKQLDKPLIDDFYAFVKDDLVLPSYSFSKQIGEHLITDSNHLWSEYYPKATNMFKELTHNLKDYLFYYYSLTEEVVIDYAEFMFNLTRDTLNSVYSTIKFYYNHLMSETNSNKTLDIDYKLPNNKISLQTSEEIINDINDLKERILSEAMQNLINYKDTNRLVDIDLMRKELDQKFNYTLNMMSNKLVEQSMQIEMSKSMHEKELKQMKSILDEIESRYTFTLNQLQEQLIRQKQFLENQQHQIQQQQSKESSIQNPLEPAITNEYISFAKIEEYINKTFYVYNADKTGMTDFASESIGGSILFTRCTDSYQDNSRWFTVFDVPITRVSVSPRVVIQGSIQPGNCYAFKGSKGDLFIKLAAKITPKSFSLEHIPKELSLTGNIDSAPQNFTVYGYVSKDDISDDNRILLGNYRYDNNSKNTLQFFDVQHECNDKPISAIELKIESNAGNKDYTCLYKFRAHGKLFDNNNQISSHSGVNDIK